MYQDTERSVSISVVGQSLIALELEISKLEEDAALMHRRLALITTKQRICTETIQKLLKQSLLGNYQ